MWAGKNFFKEIVSEGYAETGAVAVIHNPDRIHKTLQYSLQSFYLLELSRDSSLWQKCERCGQRTTNST